MEAGVAVVDITPPPGLPMCGFAARTLGATGAHDPLTVRALVIDDSAIVVADVIGFDAAMSARIRTRSGLPEERVVIAATHTHGGPMMMAGRLGGEPDPAFLRRLEDGCVQAIERAGESRQPVTLAAGNAIDPEVARNRRHPGGPVDTVLPILRVRSERGALIALVAAHACHPVVLGADNRLWTADYPHVARRVIEAAHPGAIALILTGCAGDVNTGHAAAASVTLAPAAGRTFARAEQIGTRIAPAILAAPERPLGAWVNGARSTVSLDFERRAGDDPDTLVDVWRAERAVADPARRALLDIWLPWAARRGALPAGPLEAQVGVLDWGGLPIIALPGEVFAATAMSLRASLPGDGPAILIGYADDNPGYFPPASEYAFGGYEVDEAHRFYGAPAPFAPGSAERLAEAALHLWRGMLAERRA